MIFYFSAAKVNISFIADKFIRYYFYGEIGVFGGIVLRFPAKAVLDVLMCFVGKYFLEWAFGRSSKILRDGFWFVFQECGSLPLSCGQWGSDVLCYGMGGQLVVKYSLIIMSDNIP